MNLNAERYQLSSSNYQLTRAVTKILSKTTEPVTADAVATNFTNARRTAVAEILETLCTMGHAHRGKAKGTYLP